MDRFLYSTPARVKVLVVPVNGCQAREFDKFVGVIRSASEIRLLDVAPIPECQYFNPQTFPQGRLLYDISSTPPEDSSIYLHDFEPFRKTFITIGVGPYTPSPDLEAVEKSYPGSILHHLILFDAPAAVVAEANRANDHTAKQVFYPGNSITAIETVMCEVSRNFLHALNKYASSYLNITLRSPVSITDSRILAKTISQAQKRLLSLSHTAVDPKSKTQIKHVGRQAKLMGNFYLLAGKLSEAMHQFTEALVSLKKADDALWLALALEGLGVAALMLSYLKVPYQFTHPVVLSLLSVSKGRFVDSPRRSSVDRSLGVLLPRNSSSSGLSISFLMSGADLLSNGLPDIVKVISHKVLLLYHQSTNDYENTVPDIVYVELVIRSIRFMVGVHLSPPDLDEATLEAIVHSRPLKAPAANSAWFSKDEIIDQISRVFSLELVHMDFADQCRIYSSLAAIYSDMGLLRKRAFILRILLVALLPKFRQLALHGFKLGSLRQIFDELFAAYGITAEPEVLPQAAASHACDWVLLQFQFLKECVQILEATKDLDYLLKVCTVLLTRYTHCLSLDDQILIRDKIDSLIQQSDRHNLNLVAPYWDPFLVRKVKYVSNKSKDSLTPFTEYDASDDSTIFNPLKTQTLAKDKLLIRDEIYHLKVTLQNPFDFEIEIADLLVVSEGVEVQTLKNFIRPAPGAAASFAPSRPLGSKLRRKAVETSSTAAIGGIFVPPRSVQHVSVAFRPMGDGKLAITGFDIVVGNCALQRFEIMDKEVFDVDNKTKSIGRSWPQKSIESVVTNLLENTTGRMTKKSLQLVVVPPQPTLSLTDISVSNGWLMLLEGEKFEFSIRLTNHSMEPVNYLSFLFWDSNIAGLNNKLNNNTLSSGPTIPANEVYELEWQLLKAKTFRILNKDEITSKYKVIPPQSDLNIDYEIVGKRGMKELKIVLDYSNKTGDVANSFVKSVSVLLNLLVLPGLEIIGCDLVPLLRSSLQALGTPATGTHSHLDRVFAFISSVMESDSIDNYCLMILDIRNNWTSTLRATLAYDSYTTEEDIPSQKTVRLLMPIRRLRDTDGDFSQPIPSLRNKQFVKNYFISEEEDARMRKTFWMRHAVLERLTGLWTSVGADLRKGVLDTRQIRFTPGMARVLVVDGVELHHEVLLGGQVLDGTTVKVGLQQFYTLRTRITNKCKHPVHGVLRHSPFPAASSTRAPPTIDRRILVNGVLQQHMEPLAPNESVQVDLAFTVLEKGMYEWGVVLDVLDSADQFVAREPLHLEAS